MLLNNDMSIGWFYEALKGVSEIHCFISNDKESDEYRNGRIAFIDSETKLPRKDNNKPQFVLVFDPYRIGWKQTSYIVLKEIIDSYKI